MSTQKRRFDPTLAINNKNRPLSFFPFKELLLFGGGALNEFLQLVSKVSRRQDIAAKPLNYKGIRENPPVASGSNNNVGGGGPETTKNVEQHFFRESGSRAMKKIRNARKTRVPNKKEECCCWVMLFVSSVKSQESCLHQSPHKRPNMMVSLVALFVWFLNLGLDSLLMLGVRRLSTTTREGQVTRHVLRQKDLVQKPPLWIDT